MSKVREILTPKGIKAEFLVSRNTFKEFDGEFAISPAVFNF
jgi:hypothetical protein